MCRRVHKPTTLPLRNQSHNAIHEGLKCGERRGEHSPRSPLASRLLGVHPVQRAHHQAGAYTRPLYGST
jgi:hypothetical protein